MPLAQTPETTQPCISIRALAIDAGASSTAIAADDMIRLCVANGMQKKRPLHGGCGP